MLTDNYNRQINYLRLSVTDRCNLRCLYCVPHYDVQGTPRRRILSYDELFRLARESVALGIRKIRITGGEPLVRPGVVHFLERVDRIEPAPELVLTTNGTLLTKLGTSSAPGRGPATEYQPGFPAPGGLREDDGGR